MRIWLFTLLFPCFIYSQTIDVTPLDLNGRPPVSKRETPVKMPNDIIGFRNFTWGASVEQVKSGEKSKLSKRFKKTDRQEVIQYEGNVMNKPVIIHFYFIDGQLYMGIYEFIQKHTQENDYIKDYENLQNSIKEKYGSYYHDETNWKDELYRSDNSKWGFAVSLGHLEYLTIWNHESGIIITSLRGENYKISLSASYVSHKHKEIAAEDDKKKKFNDF